MSKPTEIAFRQEDRDLLVEMKVLLDRAIKDINDLKDNTVHRVNLLDENKMDKAEVFRLRAEDDKRHFDHEKRLRKVEKWGAMAIGALAIIQFIFKFLLQ